ncbi:hypothetical protein BAU15_06740 [Enterococcus sp. JM4C]|uniref:acyltransferase n=1 Tax=Candidatus Enterococcus huntleyi TaxID=1857217 RepID=UPI00137A7564|nr:acyltransferase [Enterococcus sp. JM4C]KAF1297239.1 hypothetical protein BAU15_06740 [Enterococcus sp. JM4C]
MELVEEYKQQKLVGTNRIIINDAEGVDSDLVLKNTKIAFKGERNVVVVDKGTNITNSSITFEGNDSLVYIKKSRNPVNIRASVFSETCLFIDTGASFNGAISISLSERENVLIGKDCMFSFGIWLRTSDVHLIYDLQGNRINNSKGIILGDHIWVGQDVHFTKGSMVGSGTVVGAKSLVSGILSSNCTYAGIPCRKIKSDTFWDRPSTHNYSREQTKESQKYKGNIANFNFVKKNKGNLSEKIAVYNALKELKSVPEKIKLIEEKIVNGKPLVCENKVDKITKVNNIDKVNEATSTIYKRIGKVVKRYLKK